MDFAIRVIMTASIILIYYAGYYMGRKRAEIEYQFKEFEAKIDKAINGG